MATDLTAEQRRIVEADLRAHLLVTAAPGSGKTLVIAARIRHLIEQEQVEPAAIVAMTFSRQAAAELEGRVGRAGIWVGTFHAICATILSDHGASIGMSLPLRIADAAEQRQLLIVATGRAGYPLPDDAKEQDRCLKEIGRRLSERKRQGWDGFVRLDTRQGLPEPMIAEIGDAYSALLAERGTLDFDDLIGRAIETLLGDASGQMDARNVGAGAEVAVSEQGTVIGEVARVYRSRLRFVFLDEFHDISPEQQELVRLLAPGRGDAGKVLAVADQDQAIYGWRGGDAAKALSWFRREYRPREFSITTNFRSEPAIVVAAEAVLGEHQQSRIRQIVQAAERTDPVVCYRYPDRNAEAAGLIALVRGAIATTKYDYGDIAVLYREHARTDQVEAAMIAAEMPVWRVRDNRFFAHPEVREMLRYLALALSLRDDTFCAALNWPRVLVDEVTMTDLRRRAIANAVPVCELARAIAADTADASPLTRAAVREFVALVDGDLVPVADAPMTDLIPRLLPPVEARHSPIPAAERENLLGLLEFLTPQLTEPAARLGAAVAIGQPIVLRHDGSVDASAAAVLLAHVLADYLGHAATVVVEGGGSAPAGAFIVALGEVDEGASGAAEGITLQLRQLRAFAYPVVTQAWRLGQMVLMAGERLDQGRFVVFDLETGSAHPSRAEILELAAGTFEEGELDQSTVRTSRIRPSGHGAIEAGATTVHGLTWRDVEHAEPPAAVLPRVLERLDGETLVGHNIEMFDYPILRRAARNAGLPEPRHLLIDTLPMARRLVPGLRSYKLGDLATHFEIAARNAHRAAADVETTAADFGKLLDRLRQQRALDALSETLPLVAAGTLAAEVPVRDEQATLVLAGARAARTASGKGIMERWRTVAPIVAASALARLDREPTASPPDDDRWRRIAEGWLANIKVFDHVAPGGTIREFLHYAARSEPGDLVPDLAGALAADDPRRRSAADRVAMMTVHAAKGKEWPLVFVLGVEEGQFPMSWNPTEDQMAEERRVLYVGMTRAEHRLFLTWAQREGGRVRGESPFLRTLRDETLSRRPPPKPLV